jgi:predicted ABC-type exoprotein transport system permease subunit
MGGLFRLRNVTIVGYFYYLILLKLLHVSAVVSRVILANIFPLEDGRTTKTFSSLTSIK